MLCLSFHIPAINSQLVARSLNCSTAASSTNGGFIQKLLHLNDVATETGSCSAPTHFMWTTIRFTDKLSTDFGPPEVTNMQHWVVRHHYSNSFTVSTYSLNWFDTTALGSMEFKSLRAKPHKSHVLWTWVHEALLGLLNPVDYSLWTTQFYAFILYRPWIFPSPSFLTSLLSYHF